MWMIRIFFDILFPPQCIKCHKEGTPFCDTCLSICKKSLHPNNSTIISVYDFRDITIKKAIHAIKYFHKKDLLSPLTKALASEIKKEILSTEQSIWVLVPIPMPLFRKYMRGYNQAELIAFEIKKIIPILSVENVLSRKRTPIRQAITKTRQERLHNQINSFQVIGDVTNMNIILIDDVTTTGATLLEARKELLRAGAKNVRCATLAH